MGGRTAVLAAAAALAVMLAAGGGAAAQEPCGDLLQPPCPEPTATPGPGDPPAPATVTLNRPPKALVYDPSGEAELEFRGRVRGDGDVAGLKLRLTATSPDLGEDLPALRSVTDTRGRFAFAATPHVNARYRVELDPGQALEGASRTRTVRVFPAVRLRQKARDDGLRLRLTVIAPPAYPWGAPVVQGGARRASFYVRTNGSEEYVRVARRRLRDLACGDERCVRRSRHRVKPGSLLGRTDRVLACVPGVPVAGMGRPLRCPERMR